MRSDQYIGEVLEKCAALHKSGLWVGEPHIRPRAWLNNFQDVERPIAAVLLDHFSFFSAKAVDRMLLSSYRALRAAYALDRSGTGLHADWAEVRFTSVEGERPNVTDSGNLFCRKLRQVIGLPDSRFVDPAQALKEAIAGRPIAFLDDFVGSGNQFCDTWQRMYADHHPRSFEEAYAKQPFRAAYLALIATDKGVERVRSVAPGVDLWLSHQLGREASVFSLPRHNLLPDEDRISERIFELLSKYAPRLVLDGYMSTDEHRKFGFHQLGLTVAFEHSTPDATLPIFWAEGGANWVPLVRRT